MTKVLITGGAGFIGSHLTEALIREGFQVLVVDDLSTGKRVWVPKSAKFIVLDVTSPKVRELVKRYAPDYVCHLAGCATTSLALKDPARDLAVTVGGTINLLEAVKNTKLIKFLYVSSPAVYGTTEHVPVFESAALEPNSFYGMSRLHAEKYIQYYVEQYGVPAVVIRLTNVYGPRQHFSTLARFARAILKNETLILEGHGEQLRDYLFVNDAVAGLLSALKVGSGIYNLASEEEISMRELALLIGEVAGVVPKVDYVPFPAGEAKTRVYSARLARREFDWEPQVPLLDGLRLTLKWWKEQKI